MTGLDRQTGRTLWSLNLVAPGSEDVRACGYSSSPLSFGDLVIATAGGRGRAVVAVEAATGKIAWQSQDFQNGYSSPLLVDLDGQPEVIVFTYAEVSGLNPATGALEWTVAHPSDQGVNVATPIWGSDHLLFVSSEYNAATGDLAWRDRSVSRSTLVGVGNRLLILDEDGNLALATPGDSGLIVHAKASVLGARSWTVPTLSGTALYLRDTTQIVALDLGK